MKLGSLRILLVEDSPDDFILIRESLRDAGLTTDVVHEDSLAGALRRLSGTLFDCVLLDLHLRDAVGDFVISKVLQAARSASVVVLTGQGDEELALRAVSEGAQDYVEKRSFDPEALGRIVRYAVQRKRLSLRLALSEHRFNLAAKATRDGIWDWNLTADAFFAANRWYEMLGLKPKPFELKLEYFLSLAHPDDRASLEHALRSTAPDDQEPSQLEYRIAHQDGSYRRMLSRWVGVGDAGGLTRVVGAQSDVTEERLYDPLTGLPNRALLLDRLRVSLGQRLAQPNHECAILVIALDQYRQILDAFGPRAMDQLLLQLGARISDDLRPTDTACHIKGEEFAILLHDVESIAPTRTATRLASTIAMPFELGGEQMRVTVSIGIASPHGSTQGNQEQILHNAQIAAHRAMAAGGNRIEVFEAEMRVQVRRRLELEASLRKAIEESEFCVHYQPVVSSATKKMVAMEALVRWQHPNEGLIFPDTFLPCAEESGLILPMGYQVIDQVCQDLSRLPGGLPQLISFNLSCSQLLDIELLEKLDALCHKHKISQNNLQLEITEGTLISHPKAARQRLEACKERGMSIALDDFGVGYSSLSYLHQFPFDVVKLDRSFAMALDKERSRLVVANIIRLAHDLDLKVVAEGVETQEQSDLLGSMNCTIIQGYHYGRPAPFDTVVASAAVGPVSN